MPRLAKELIKFNLFTHIPSVNSSTKHLITYLCMVFLVTMSDGIMSYMSPVYINNVYNDPFIVGLVLAISSSCGLIIDLVISAKLSNKTFRFFTKNLVMFAFIFPTIFFVLPHLFYTFVLGMVVWSFYYEMRGYSNYSFVHHQVKASLHAKLWGIVLTTQYTAYFIGTLIATNLELKWDRLPLLVAMTVTAIAFIIYNLSKHFHESKNAPVVAEVKRRNLKHELSVLKVLSKRTFLLLFFSFTLMLIDVSFWTMGILYTEELSHRSPYGRYFISLYGLQGLYVGFIASKANLFGKKRTSFLLSIMTGLLMVGISTTDDILTTLLLVSGVATTYGVCLILLSAVYEDYVARLKELGNDMTTLSQIVTNLAYVIGPIVLGLIGKEIGVHHTFGAVGILLMLTSAVALVYIPKKIKMPQHELAIIEND